MSPTDHAAVADAFSAATVQQALERHGAPAAIALCRAHIAAHPHDADAYRHLAQLLSARGEDLPAQQAAMRACELAPHDSRSWSDLGRVHARAKAFDLAVRCFNEAVAIDRRDADAWHNLGLALAKVANGERALAALKTALQIDASRASSWIALGELLIEHQQDTDALECFDRAAACDPMLARARSRLGELYLERGRVDRAESLFRQALAIDLEHIEGWVGLARALEDAGNRTDARDAYSQALRRHPGHGMALANYIALLRDENVSEGETRERLVVAATVLSREDTPDEAKALVGYALAKHADRRGDHTEAARAGTIANAARRRMRGPLDRDKLAARVDGLIATYDAAFFASRRRYGLGNDQPVFIVGMPRSGTTLTEQIIDAHPRAHGAGELPDLAQLALRVLGPKEEAWQAAAILDESGSREVAQAYLRALQAGAPRGVQHISDKSPLNFFHLAFAAVLFPRARIIHCTRDARDTALSIWLENFNGDQRYATDFGDLAFFIAQYQRLMMHWRKVLPLSMLEVRYEETVEDVERQSRRLLKFLDLPWDARCLDFHSSERAVQTPSRWQVREPIYARSVSRWRVYESLLPELLVVPADDGKLLIRDLGNEKTTCEVAHSLRHHH